MAAAAAVESKKWSQAKKALQSTTVDYASMKTAPSRCKQFLRKVQVVILGAGIEEVSGAIDTVVTATLEKSYDENTEYLPSATDAKFYALLFPLLDEEMINVVDRDDIATGLHGSHLIHLLITEFVHVSAQRIAELEERLLTVDGEKSFSEGCKILSGTIADLKAVGVIVSKERHKAALINLVKRCGQTNGLGKTVALWAIDSTAKELRSAIEDWVSAEVAEIEVSGRSSTGGIGYAAARARRELECFHCHEKGHLSRNCPKKKGRQRPGKSGYTGCYKCGSKKHLARDCPETEDEFAGLVFD